MRPADAALRAAIDEVLEPRIDSHTRYLPYTAPQTSGVSRTEGVYVWDHYGNRLLDFTAGGDGALPLGHSDPAFMSVVNEQIREYDRLGPPGRYITRKPVEYAQALVESLAWPGSDDDLQVFYTPDEDSAFSVALSLAQRVTNRVYLETKVDLDCITDDTAALVVSLVTRAGRPLLPPVVQAVARDARVRGAVVVIDETRTGFGRTGKLWAQHQWEVRPDITVIGGPGGGGLPFGAVVAPRGFWDLAADQFTPSQYAGTPIVCAAGVMTLNRVDDRLCDHVAEMGAVAHEVLTEIETQFPEVIHTHRGAGLLQTIECQSPEIARRLVVDARRAGLIVADPQPHVIRLTPPLVISEIELRRGLDIIAGACLDQTEDG